MDITPLGDGYTALVGYGHACYAVRAYDGTMVVFGGWYCQNARPRQRSGSTTVKSNHFPAIRRLLDPEVFVGYKLPDTRSEESMTENADYLTTDQLQAAPSMHNAREAFDKVLAAVK